MTVLEKIKRCVSLVWDFQEIYGEEDIEEFCHNELHTYPQHDEIMEYFKYIEECEKCYSLARAYRNDNEKQKAQIEKMKCCSNCDNWNWKHNKCEKKLKGDCFKHSKWVMRNF